MDKLNENDYSNLINIINGTAFKGLECEYIALLKSKLELAKKTIRSEDNGELSKD